MVYSNPFTFTEIPLFHVLNARVTFGNLNGTENCPEKVVTIETTDEAGPSEETEGTDLHKKVKCLIDKSVFMIPSDYRDLGAYSFDRQMQGKQFVFNIFFPYKTVDFNTTSHHNYVPVQH